MRWDPCLTQKGINDEPHVLYCMPPIQCELHAGQPNVSVEGFCKGMCPDYQLRLRIQNVTENSLEAVDPKGRGRGIEQLATKKWERNVRSSA